MTDTTTQYYLADISSLIPYARNSRTHTDEQVAQVAASIREFGFLNPGAPRFVFLVSVDANSKFTLEWFDLNEAAELYKAWGNAK